MYSSNINASQNLTNRKEGWYLDVFQSYYPFVHTCFYWKGQVKDPIPLICTTRASVKIFHAEGQSINNESNLILV
jgi:hypothetical protein